MCVYICIHTKRWATDGWTHGWTEGWMAGWMNGWMDDSIPR